MTAYDRIANRSITVLGMARSGLAVARLAHSMGAHVFVSDSAEITELGDAIRALEALGIEFETGGHTAKVHQADYVIISPGIPSDCEIVNQIRESGTPIFSELEFASWLLNGKMIAVTGSNGKTTTAHMIHNILLAEKRQSILCGNVGLPFSDVVRDIELDGVAVVEVSSFQLEFVDQFKPNVAVITNLTPDHLERHGSMRSYREAKLRIADAQDSTNVLCLNIDSSALDAMTMSSAARRCLFGAEASLTSAGARADSIGAFQRDYALWIHNQDADVKIMDISELQVPGQHNVENALAAASATYAFGVSIDAIRTALHEFSGVEHRIERVGEHNGVTFVNDSKATNLDATIKALEALPGPIRLILGGRGKGEDFSSLAPQLSARVASIIAIGETKHEIFGALGKDVAIQFASDMSDAVAKLFAECKPGETALLSPGCASFDMYNNFEDRGSDFKRLVLEQIERMQSNVVKN